ncbi:MAG: DUF554 domain-containing protein [Anaerolineae bacterium]|nr:DUF554 domain-containing protein [Anaerolineae bacterium]
MNLPIGSLVNVGTVILGSSIGLLLRKKFPQNIQAIIFQGVGLATLVLGMQMALQVENILILIFSLILGGILGEGIHLETRLENLGNALKIRVKSQDARFTEGLITAFLIFCVGSMTFVGAINEGLNGDRTLLYTKSILDGFTSMALASVYGVGVSFSVLPLFIVQAGLSLLAAQFQSFFSDLIIAQLTATGGALILGIGINLLDIKPIKTTNLLPALVVVIVLTLIFG